MQGKKGANGLGGFGSVNQMLTVNPKFQAYPNLIRITEDKCLGSS